MSQLLVVHADDEVRRHLSEILKSSGHAVLAARDGVAALGWVRTSPVDLVLCDARLHSPDPIELRMSIFRMAGGAPVRFLHLMGGGEEPRALGRLMQDEDFVLLRAPFDARVRRFVDAMLGDARRVEGSFEDDSFDRQLAGIEANREDGILTAFRGTVVKKVIFRQGKIAFVGSSDPRELIGQTFVNAGLITEAELREAMARQAESREPLAKVLQKVANVSGADADRTVRRKFEEGVLDLYLWDEGGWSYAKAPEIAPANALELPILALRTEGRRRAEAWSKLRARIPGDGLCFDVKKGASTAGDRLLELLAKGATLAQARLELRASDYEVYARIGELLDAGVLSISNALPAPTEEELRAADAASAEAARRSAEERARLAALEGASDPGSEAAALLEQGEAALAADDFDTARRAYKQVLVLDPANAGARRGLVEIDGLVARHIRESGITRDRSVVRRLPDDEVTFRGIRPAAAFVLSRIQPWGTRIEDLLVVTPLPEVEVLELIEEMVANGVLSLA